MKVSTQLQVFGLALVFASTCEFSSASSMSTPAPTASCASLNRTSTDIIEFLTAGPCTCPRPNSLALSINCPLSTLQSCETNFLFDPTNVACFDALDAFGAVTNCILDPCKTDCECGQVAIDFLGSTPAMVAAPKISGFFACIRDAGCTDLTGIPGGEANVRTLLNSTTCPEQVSFFETAFAVDLGSCSLSCPPSAGVSSYPFSITIYALTAIALCFSQEY